MAGYAENIKVSKGVNIIRWSNRNDYFLRIYLRDKKKCVYKSMDSLDKEYCLANWLDIYTTFMSSNDFKEREKKRLSVINLTKQYEKYTYSRVETGQIKASSAEQTMKNMRRIIKWLKGQKVLMTDQIDRDSYKNFGESLLSEYSPKTVNGDVVQFNNYLSWMAEEGHISRDAKPILKKVKDRKRYNEEVNPAFTGEDYRIFVDTYNMYEIGTGEDRDDPDEYQKWWNRKLAGIFFRMLYYSGARPHELLAMKMCDIEAKEYQLPDGGKTMRGLLRIPYDTKTGYRESVINGWAIDRLIGHLKGYSHPITMLEVNDETPIFVNPERGKAFTLEGMRAHMRSCLRLAGLTKKKYTIYSLRSTYITEMLLRGTSIEDIARNVGNSPETIRKHYDNVQNILKSDELLKMNKFFMSKRVDDKM